jgi:hypothetical protein
VTRVAAEIAGCGETLGTIEPGKSATVVLWSGDPFEVVTSVKRAWIDGAEVDLNDRQRRMRAKYMEKELQRRPVEPDAGPPEAGQAPAGTAP